MRKLLVLVVLILCFASVVRADIVDSLGEWSYTTPGGLYSGNEIGSGQSFTCTTAVTLDSVLFYLNGTTGSPTGNIYAKIYSHSGTYGTSSIPGDSLCVSDAVDAATLVSWALEPFTFSGANQITLEASTYYVVVVLYDGGDVSNQVGVGLSNNTSAHSGNGVYTSDNITWTPSGSYERIFYVYGTAESEGDTCCSTSDSLPFGNCDTNTTDLDSFYIYNCGDSALVDSIDWAGLLPEFTPMSDSTYNIASGVTTYFLVQFAPTAVTSYADTIDLGHDSCGNIVITGTGASGVYPSGDNVFYLAPPNPASGLSAGSDENDGTHPDTAWATLQYADGQLSAGDTLFVMGGLYTNEQYFQATVDGTAPSPIVLQAYGDSHAVFQDGYPGEGEYEDEYFIYITTADHLVINGNNYSDASDTTCNIVLQSGGVDGMDVNRNNTVILANGAADGNGYSDSVTIYRVEVNGRYCGHDVDPESSSDYLYNGVRILNAAFWNITDCEIHHVGDSTWSTGFGYPLTIIDCIGMQIEGNYLHHGGHDMMMLDGSCYCTIKNNLFMNYWGGGLYVYGGSHYNLIENNLIYHTGEAYGDGEAPDYPKAGVMICAPLNVLRRNIVYTPWNQGVHLQSYLAASTPDSGSCHNLVYNNTIYHSKWGYGNVILQSRLSSGMRTTDNVFANNIIYGAWGCGGGTACMSCPGDYLSPEILAYEGAGDIARNTFNNNLIRHRASVATYDSLYIFATVGCVNYSLAEIEAADPTYWHDNITNLPDFVSYNPDSGDTLLTGWWHLQEGSACIDSGVSVAVHDTIGLYVESLYPGYGWDTLAWYGTAPDIGAYEAQYYDTCCSTPADYNYGNVNAGGYQDNDFYIINCGDSTLHLDIGLSDSTEFTIQSGGGLDTLTGSQSCTVSVRFEPDDEGAEADTLTFGLDACDTVFLSGTGVTMNVADCSLSTAEVDFGNVEIDSIEYASFTIFNVGETPCDTLELNITETSDTFGIYLHGGVQHVVDGDSLTVGVYFHPEQFGIHACTLQTGSDSCSTVILGGVGIATPCCSESQSSFAFGSVYIDSSSVDTLFITNCDPDCTLTCNPDLADSTQYWITWVSEGWDEWTLDPSEICSLEVTFIPTSVGWKFDTLTWTQDSCDAVYISGRGVDTTDGLLGYQLQWWNKPHEYFLRMAP